MQGINTKPWSYCVWLSLQRQKTNKNHHEIWTRSSPSWYFFGKNKNAGLTLAACQEAPAIQKASTRWGIGYPASRRHGLRACGLEHCCSKSVQAPEVRKAHFRCSLRVSVGGPSSLPTWFLVSLKARTSGLTDRCVPRDRTRYRLTGEGV